MQVKPVRTLFTQEYSLTAGAYPSVHAMVRSPTRSPVPPPGTLKTPDQRLRRPCVQNRGEPKLFSLSQPAAYLSYFGSRR